jgi:alpha-galactosidase
VERRPALEGVDFAINEIQVGGYRATVTDFEIPRRFGVRQTIADTLGIGGIMRGLRTIPLMVWIGNDLHELAPDAAESRTRWRWCRGACTREPRSRT